MKKTNQILFYLVGLFLVIACGNDDDDNGVIQLRDPGEVYAENIVEMEAFLQTHTYNYEDFDPSNPADFEILIDTITAVNADKIPLIDRPELQRFSINRDDVDYNYFVLKVRQGSGELQPTFADSTLVSYAGYTLDRNVFDSSINSIWFNLPNSIEGFSLGLKEFNEATGSNQNADGTFNFDNSGIGAVFMPSGLGYFGNPPSNSIGAYDPLIFTFKLRQVEITDHDGDGILSIYEDLEGDGLLRTSGGDNTDGDNSFNFLDTDDDNDGLSTREEISDENGNLLIINGDPSTAPDTDNDGIPDYLDNSTQGQ